MSPEDFADLAVRLGPSVQSKPIFETLQFRVGGRAFATLGWPTKGWAVVKLDPRRQAWALGLGGGLSAEPGRRRKAGIILARLSLVDPAVAAALLAEAWRFAQPSRPGGAAHGRAAAAGATA
ncbi:hypothetical protein [Caulobacter sp.]|uniref:hypothetical protein n=1 Tax=Caulobacter sp. TaxID=78 RepID=UPI0031D5D8D3